MGINVEYNLIFQTLSIYIFFLQDFGYNFFLALNATMEKCETNS